MLQPVSIKQGTRSRDWLTGLEQDCQNAHELRSAAQGYTDRLLPAAKLWRGVLLADRHDLAAGLLLPRAGGRIVSTLP